MNGFNRQDPPSLACLIGGPARLAETGKRESLTTAKVSEAILSVLLLATRGG